MSTISYSLSQINKSVDHHFHEISFARIATRQLKEKQGHESHTIGNISDLWFN